MTMPTLPAAGDTSWRDDWAQAVHDAATDVTEATDAATPVTLVKRDPSGRFKAVDGSAASDVATKGQLDAASTADRARANHTGTQSADTVVDGTTNHVFTAADDTKLTGIATGATANSSDATLLARANHTGTQAISTVTGLQTALDAKSNLLTTQSTQTGTTYTFVLGDAGTLVEGNNASAQTYTVPPNSSVAFPVGTSIVVRQYGAGQITLAAGAGVTLRSRGAALKLAGQYAELTATKRATDEWVVSGDVTT